MGRKQTENFLDYVPVRNPDFEWDLRDGIVTVHMIHRGFYHRIAQKFFHTPRVSHIALERYGSFLWQQIDGVRTVGALADAMKAQFGAEAEPLYPRLVKHMQILRNNRFILFAAKGKRP